MPTVASRISNLEKRLAPQTGIMAVLRAGPSDAEIDAILQRAGIDRHDSSNLIIIRRTVYEDRTGGLSPYQPRAALLYMAPLKK